MPSCLTSFALRPRIASMMPNPRRWWPGALDVEQLAWSSVCAARDAAQALAETRGLAACVEAEPALTAAAFAAIEHLRIDGAEPQGWAPMSGYFPTADGWVRTHANYPHHHAAITQALGATTRDELAATVSGMPVLEVEDVVTQHHGIAVAVRTPRQWQEHPHGAATVNDPWVRVAPTGSSRDLTNDPSEPLSGVRVLDLTRVIAGPTCSQLLACLGAQVLRVDPPDRPELLEQYLSNGMGKRSAAVDLASDPAALEEVLTAADVVLLGYRPGSLARFGLTPEELLDRYPHLVVASLSAWGEHGPWAHRPGFDSIVQAATGIATICGTDERPGALPVQALDHATGYQMAAEILSLLATRTSGLVSISLLGAARTLLTLPDPPQAPASPDGALTVRRVDLDTAHGRITTVPPAITLDGRLLTPPLTAYGRSSLRWH